MAYNNADATQDEDNNNWILQRTEDGTGFYHFNTITGEMKFDKEEIAKEESILLLDSGSESDHRSTIDIPWSDGSTLHSIEEKV